MKDLELHKKIYEAFAIKDGYGYKDLSEIDPVEVDGIKRWQVR